MLELTKKYIRRSAPRSVPKWRQHIENLNKYKLHREKEFLGMNRGYDSGGLNILKFIINNVNWARVNQYPDDIDRYFNYLKYIQDDLGQLFNPVKAGLGLNNTFIDKLGKPTSEFLCPITDTMYMKLLPMDKPFEQWKDIKPLTLWWHDSWEHTQHLLGNKFKFFNDQPSYALFFLDPVSLVMKFYKYLESNPDYEQHYRVRDFIHRHVINHLFDDELDIYLLKTINIVAGCSSKEEVIQQIKKIKEVSDIRYGYPGGRLEEACIELFEEFETIKNGNVNFGSFLSSKLLYSGSIIDRIESIEDWYDVSKLNQYTYIRVLRDIEYIKLIVNIIKFVPNRSDVRGLIYDLRVKCRMMALGKMSDMIQNRQVKKIVSDELKELYAKIMMFDM